MKKAEFLTEHTFWCRGSSSVSCIPENNTPKPCLMLSSWGQQEILVGHSCRVEILKWYFEWGNLLFINYYFFQHAFPKWSLWWYLFICNNRDGNQLILHLMVKWLFVGKLYWIINGAFLAVDPCVTIWKRKSTSDSCCYCVSGTNIG